MNHHNDNNNDHREADKIKNTTKWQLSNNRLIELKREWIHFLFNYHWLHAMLDVSDDRSWNYFRIYDDSVGVRLREESSMKMSQRENSGMNGTV